MAGFGKVEQWPGDQLAYTDWDGMSGMTPVNYNNTVLTGSGDPDLVARFDYVRYRRPEVPLALQGLDLFDPGEVTDTDLLTFLGDSAD